MIPKTHSARTALCRWCQDHVIKYSLTNSCLLALQPHEQNANTCLLYFSEDLGCGGRGASQLSVTCCSAQVNFGWAFVLCKEQGMLHTGLGKPQWQFMDAGPCKCDATRGFCRWQFHFCPGAGRDGWWLHWAKQWPRLLNMSSEQWNEEEYSESQPKGAARETTRESFAVKRELLLLPFSKYDLRKMRIWRF